MKPSKSISFICFFFFFFIALVTSQTQDSCSSNLNLNGQVPFDTTTLHCAPVWPSHNFILRVSFSFLNYTFFFLNWEFKNPWHLFCKFSFEDSALVKRCNLLYHLRKRGNNDREQITNPTIRLSPNESYINYTAPQTRFIDCTCVSCTVCADISKFMEFRRISPR